MDSNNISNMDKGKAIIDEEIVDWKDYGCPEGLLNIELTNRYLKIA
jgi:hypothetical protein